MSVGVNLLTMLLNNRELHDIDLKLESVQMRMLSNARAVQSGDMDLFEGFVVEKELQARKHHLESKREAVKNWYEMLQKSLKKNVEDSFKLNTSA